jgi:hypothetical protein
LKFNVGHTSYENRGKASRGTCPFYRKRWYNMKYGLEVFSEGTIINDDFHGKRYN